MSLPGLLSHIRALRGYSIGFPASLVAAWLGSQGVTAPARAEMHLRPDSRPQVIFSGVPQPITIHFRNLGEERIESRLSTRLFQVAGSTTMPVGNAAHWKTLSILGGQTIEETFQVETPPVRAETRFILVWYADDRKLGVTELRAWPKDLLKRLMAFGPETDLGLWDSGGFIGPALQAAGVLFRDITDEDQFFSFHGNLVLVSREPGGRDHLTRSFKKKVSEGTGIVWLQLAAQGPEPHPVIVHTEAGTKAACVIAPMSNTNHFADSALAQVTLVRLAEYAAGHGQAPLAGEGIGKFQDERE
jgi:hypothetical protein